VPLFNGIIVMEEITRICPGSADVFQAASFGPIRAVVLLAGEEMKRKVLPAVISGEHVISLGMTETDAGSARCSDAGSAWYLQDAGIRISMDGWGRVYDNIFVERLWRTAKYEEVYLHEYPDGLGGP
jgi:alkylation response protein AidB-like acyl-CoA dehydrogenase